MSLTGALDSVAGTVTGEDPVRAVYTAVIGETAVAALAAAGLLPVELEERDGPMLDNRVLDGIRCVRWQRQHRYLTTWTDDTPPPPDTPDVPAAPAWAAGSTYNPGDTVTYQNVVYRALEAHTSQPAWTPTAAPTLWAQV